jgi:hypothetical protein
MAISDIWTIEPQGSPGSAVTLASLGVQSARISRESQTPAVLSLSIPGELALTMDLVPWVWDSQWVLRRSGVVAYRGRLDLVPRMADADSSSIALTFRCVIRDLMQTPYVQEWTSLATSGGTTGVSFGRVRLGVDNEGNRQTTKDAIAQVIAAAAIAGTEVSIDATALPDLIVPTIEGRGKMCGELLRDILRWHPGAMMQTVSSEEGDTILISYRETAEAVTFTIGEPPLSGVPKLVKREDLAVDSVHVSYEAQATQYRSVTLAEGDEPIIQSDPRLVVGTDVYPADAPLTRRSMRVDLAAPSPDGGGVSSGGFGPQPHWVPVKTRPLPPTGSYADEARKFYLEHAGLKEFGLTHEDIRMPVTEVGDVKPHTVSFAHPNDDPDDPMFEMPAAINPDSTPLWKPASVSDFPRYLRSGSLGDWMNVKAAEVLCEATIGVLKSAVDAMSARRKAIFFGRYKPRPGNYESATVWMIQATVRVVATTARTRNYPARPTTSTGGEAPTTGGSATQALADVMIPDLAEKLYADRAVAPWEGSISLLEEHAGAQRYLGKVLNLEAADRPEWATMRALIQSESVDLTTGATDLQVGPADHLEPADWISLHRATRRLDDERGRVGYSPQPPLGDTEAEEPEEGDGGAFFPSFGPRFELQIATPIIEEQLWDLEVVDAEAGAVKMLRPGTIIKDFADVKVGLSVGSIGSTFNVAAGDKMWIKITGAANAPVATLETGSSWTDSPAPVQTASSGVSAAFEAYRYFFWEFRADQERPTDIRIKEGLYARRLGQDAHFLREAITYHQPGNAVFTSHILREYHGVLA